MQRTAWNTLAPGGSAKVIDSRFLKVGWLVGGLEHGFYDFPYIGNVIIPIDELIFLRRIETTNQHEHIV